MNRVKKFFSGRLKSFKYAFAGLKDILATEYNAWIHAVMTVVILSLSIWLRLDFVKFVLIIIVITLVWVAEAFNTVLEVIVNMVSPRYSEAARRAKDIAAGAVLVAAIGAAAVGVMLLGPLLIDKLGL